jgi:hypothetical protein
MKRNGKATGAHMETGREYVVEHRANVPGVREQPLIWRSAPIRAPSAGEALEAFFERPEGFRPHGEEEFLQVRRAACIPPEGPEDSDDEGEPW